MRSSFATMFLLLALSASTGCTVSHYQDDIANGGDDIIGFVRTTAPISVQMRNLLTNNWDTLATIDPSTMHLFWFTSYKLYPWSYPIPSNLSPRYRNVVGQVDIRFKQGNILLMIFDPDLNTAQPYAESPFHCIWHEHEDNYMEGTDYDYAPDGLRRFFNQQPFLDCGLDRSNVSGGNLSLHVN